MNKSLAERVRQLELERAQLTERILRQRARLRLNERRTMARRRFVVGEYVCRLLDADGPEAVSLRLMLQGLVLSSRDRELIGLDGQRGTEGRERARPANN